MIPDFQTLMLPFMQHIADGQEHSIEEAHDALAQQFKLTEEELKELLPSGRQERFRNRVHWVKTHLRMAGLVENTKRGYCAITDKGKSVLSDKQETINKKFLRQLPGYIENVSRSETDEESDIVATVNEFVPEAMPEKETDFVEPENMGDIRVPFDPSLINIRRDPYTLGLLIDRLENKEINFFTLYQRRFGLWDLKKQSRFIESILLRLPLPAFYFDETDDNLWQVIDGLQRTHAIREFVVENKLQLAGLEFLGQFNGCKYSDLPRELQRRIKTEQISVFVVQKGTPDEVKINIFKRINTGGLLLTPQEIRHAVNQGVAAKFVAELASLEQFKEATCYIIKPDRMEDCDFVTRFISFYLLPYQNYEPDLDSFMTKGMRAIKEKATPETREKMKSDFIKAMNTAMSVFGEDAFRKRENSEDRRKPLNKALFEVLSVNFAKLNETQMACLLERKVIFQEKFMAINRDAKFKSALSAGTAQKDNVHLRFLAIERIIQETIGLETP